MAKLVGYILALIGIAGLAIAMVPEIGSQVNLPDTLSKNQLIIASIALAAIGIFMIVRSGSRKQPVEVPIYRGKHVVGYRRHK